MWLYKKIYWLIMQSRFLQIWSGLYRLGQRKWKKLYPLENFVDPVALQTELDKIEYHKDTWKQLWDVCYSPHYLKYILDAAKLNDQPDGSFDCTSYAILAANMLDPHFHPILLSVFYKKKNKFRFNGHMVCVFETIHGFRHMGNWGLSPIFKSIKLIAQDIAFQSKSTLIGYTTLEKDLGVIKVHV